MFESTNDKDKPYQHHQNNNYPNTGGTTDRALKDFKKVEKKCT